jgi:hypothetical protein
MPALAPLSLQNFLVWNMSVPEDVLDSIIRPQAKQAALDISLAIMEPVVHLEADNTVARYQLFELEFMVRYRPRAVLCHLFHLLVMAYSHFVLLFARSEIWEAVDAPLMLALILPLCLFLLGSLRPG